ncbi:bifunctional folylpolyglutamate synthase/dihydrofolate synthase [Marivirga sp. S37H4]|uniref:Dihydrofolate synthase/folylpolyglutamate synthase n=1 Tax=Marivirga aurantiaca TaxID=2802615 RepID=A0A934WW96_9BACT|nr:folylpolyglutamate synthase/dihydrofolate synthase family protein [Marivirga aurantiaca]MBK6264233.1 bifunctional folylpolyglutamate synthase/dihydrofolate synthase [Marivirga aurantiaca]
MTYEEAEAFLFERLPMYQRIGGAAYKKDLSNTLAILNAIDNPHLKGRYIHVAGTNGKGSTSSILASILKEAGYKVGLYTSPHLKSFTERIRINGEEIPKAKVAEYVEKYKVLVDQFQPSFFELTTAMAFDYFAEENVDISVIEVGLGGRLDSTNVIVPELSIITQIGLDHQQFLGDTTAEIVKEKAGIIKENVPVVTSVVESELREIIQSIATAHDADYYYSKDLFEVEFLRINPPYWQYNVKHKAKLLFESIEVALGGSYQLQNLQTVFTAIHVLNKRDIKIKESAVFDGLKNIQKNSGLKGRWQVVQEKGAGLPRIIADTGHNLSAFDHLIPMLQQESFEHLHIVFGAVNDKDPTPILELLPKNAFYYFTQAQIPRAMPVDQLKEVGDVLGLKSIPFETVSDAWKKVNENAGKNDLIFVGGSTFVVAEIPII